LYVPSFRSNIDGMNLLQDWEQSQVINTDKAPTYAAALADLKAEG
jgi:transposase, IS6 family